MLIMKKKIYVDWPKLSAVYSLAYLEEDNIFVDYTVSTLSWILSY